MDQETIVDGIWRVRRPVTGSYAPGWPRVVILHSFYRSESPSGENETVLRQYSWLAQAGVDVSLVSVTTDDLSKSTSYALRTAARVASGRGLSPKRLLQRLSPDVVHVHNLFPNVSSRWIPTSPWAIVVSIHNYRPLCAAATLSRNGEDCHLCIDSSPMHGLVHRCYRGSLAATMPMTARALAGFDRRHLLEAADILLAPSGVVRDAYFSAGIGPVEVLLQPTAERGGDEGIAREARLLFVGRLSAEKGILDLLASWPPSVPLTIVGHGPLEDEARTLSDSRGLLVDFEGRVSDQRLTDVLRSATALVFPSSWREGAPAVYAEALSAGLPVISVAGNAVADFVARDQTGIVLAQLTEYALKQAAEDIARAGPEINSRCRQIFQRDYTTDVWMNQLQEFYRRALSYRTERK